MEDKVKLLYIYYMESIVQKTLTIFLLFIISSCSYTQQEKDNYQKDVIGRANMQVIPLPKKTTIVLYADEIFSIEYNKLKTKSESLLNQVLQVINNNPETKQINIRAYTDNSSSSAKHETLLQANTIAAYLWKHGIPQEKISAKGYGSINPVSNNKTSKGRADNRRIEITLLTKQEPPLG